MLTTKVQIALACFGAGAPDGIHGAKTTQAVRALHHMLIKDGDDSGNITDATLDFLRIVSDSLPSDKELQCTCGICTGFGMQRNLGVYKDNKPHVEAYYQYEYKGVSLLTRWTVAMITRLYPEYRWRITSGYRCHDNNKQHHRTSTNHMGKAIDIAPLGLSYDDAKTVCATVRIEMQMLGSQIGWSNSNTMSMEPLSLAPNWLHVDCRTYDRKYITGTTEGAL